MATQIEEIEARRAANLAAWEVDGIGADEADFLLERVRELERERDRAMAVLEPSMPESGLEDERGLDGPASSPESSSITPPLPQQEIRSEGEEEAASLK